MKAISPFGAALSDLTTLATNLHTYCKRCLFSKDLAVGEGEELMSFGLYIVGFLIMIGGLIYGATILHVSPQWIAVGSIVLIGLAILKGVQATRGRDPS